MVKFICKRCERKPCTLIVQAGSVEPLSCPYDDPKIINDCKWTELDEEKEHIKGEIIKFLYLNNEDYLLKKFREKF